MQIEVIIAAAATVLWLLAIWPGRGRKDRMAVFERQLIAHRGLHKNKGKAPENSLAAFRLAAEQGYGIELDVRETADEELVVCHDDFLKRVVPGHPGFVSRMTLAELRALRLFGSDEGIPTFEEALEVIGGRVPVIVEVKSENLRRSAAVSEHTAALLDGYRGITAVESFNPAVVRWFRKHRPQTLRGQLSERFYKHKPFPGSIGMFLLSCCVMNFWTKPDFIAYRFTNANLMRFRLMRDLFHTSCAGWTIRSEEQLQAAARDFDVIIFDRFIPAGGAVTGRGETEVAQKGAGVVRRHMLVSGDVTGVGFRYRAVHIAHSLDVTGWVRNNPDGTVEMEAQGLPEQIERLLSGLRAQRWITISGVESKEIPVVSGEYEFKVRY